MRTALTACLCLLLLAACGDSDKPGGDSTDGAAADYSTPKASLETMVRAAAEKDVNLIAAGLSKTCEGEFKPLLEKRAGAKDLDEWKEIFATASIGSVDIKGSNAVVDVVLGNGRKEQIHMKQEDGKWLIHGF